MKQYQVTETQIAAIQDRLVFSVGAATAKHIADTHPRTLTTEHVVNTGGGCEAYIVRYSLPDDHLIVVWTDPAGMDLPDGTGKDQFLCGVYRDEISEDPLAMNDGDPERPVPF